MDTDAWRIRFSFGDRLSSRVAQTTRWSSISCVKRAHRVRFPAVGAHPRVGLLEAGHDQYGSPTLSQPRLERAFPGHSHCFIAQWARMRAMPFGQQSGPPASALQVRELLTLLKDAGHSDFRDARGPMGFTQRQAAGKFSRDEAAAFIAQLLDAESDGSNTVAAPTWRQSAQEQMMSSLSSEQLAGELRRRGWTAIEP